MAIGNRSDGWCALHMSTAPCRFCQAQAHEAGAELLPAAMRPVQTPADARRLEWDRRFLDLAKLVSTWSKDPSTQTGAVLVAGDKRVISLGYNGFPRNMPDAEKYLGDREEKYSRIVHCEMNALIQAREPLHGATLYTWPLLSCDRCVVHMLQAGVTRFVAPQLDAERAQRWAAALAKSKAYITECGGQWLELSQP